MDNTPSDGRRFLLMALWAVWLMSFAYAFVAAFFAPDAANELDQGLNKISVFLDWQAVAGVIAVAVFGVGLAWEKRSTIRRWSKYPILLALLQAAIVSAIAISSRIN